MTELVLSTRQWLRFGTFTAFYFAQGVPIGLFSIALPAFLTEKGASLAEIATYAGFISLPWAYKLIAGPIMDRFTYFPMGFRRPWVIIAQTGLVLSLITLALSSSFGTPSILILTWFGFVSNVFSASQDVATDGMAIDILKENERGRANAFMACGQTLGFSSFGALSGYLLVTYGMQTTAFVAAVIVGLIWLIAILMRERPGEKMLPWTEGEAAEVEHRSDASIFAIGFDLVRTLIFPMSIVLVLMEFLNRANDGIAIAFIPFYAVDVLGVESAEYARVVGLVGILSAVVGLVIGPFIDKLGAKRLLIFVLLAGAAIRIIGWVGIVHYQFDLETLTYLYIAMSIVGQCIFVATIAIFMTICMKRIAASQFSVYMSLANLSRSVGSFLYARVPENVPVEHGLLMMAGLLVLAAIVTVFFNPESHRQRIEQLEAE
ncbi:MAG: MFS transporter [Gammaproteobacteria bacterium]|nr:MFS transporter [Gammaproteobacteria bacterium]